MFAHIKETRFQLHILAQLHMHQASLAVRKSNVATYSIAYQHIDTELAITRKAIKTLERYGHLL